jgi:heavy metal sensor kinase
MFKSIRWTLLFWYALILLTVLGAFGTTLYLTLRRSTLQEIEARLRAHAEALAGAAEWDGDKGSGKFELEFSDDYLETFKKGDRNDPYYLIWNPRGQIVDRSHARMNIPRPEETGDRERDHRLEVTVRGRDGLVILVGQRLRKPLEKLRNFLGVTIGVGAAILVLALAGGWFLASHALAPIRRISETASSISASNLSQRIDVARTENELGRLAGTLNDTFARLEAAFERQMRFTADASHELRTPLSIVLSQSELALKKDRAPEEYREALDACLRASMRMKGTVDGLLTLARADAGDIDLAREPVDLKSLLEETVAMLRPMAEQAGLALDLAAAEAVRTRGDAGRLREVATNLVTNAIRYNRPGGRVDVSLRAEADAAVLTVADTGPGIPEADRPHLFERFYRVDKARSREVGGSGLGLSITKWIVEAHGGTIDFVSRVGEGTTFTVRLPRGETPAVTP